MVRTAPVGEVTDGDYRRLAELRHQIRCFLRFSERMARGTGVEPRQHQVLLAIKGMPAGLPPTIGNLAERLQLRHHSVVELVDRLERGGLVRRRRGALDRRQVLVGLTPGGEAKLGMLARHHLAELRARGPALVGALRALLGEDGAEHLERAGDSG